MIGRRFLAGGLLAVAALLALPARAASTQFCERGHEASAGQKDVLLRFSALVKDELAASGQDVALVARSGLDLRRLHTRYSHAGVALKNGGGTPWAVRELYYACDERKPRLYDEGLAGFLLGTSDFETGWISLVLLPDDESARLVRAAADKRRALDVLGATYSANAYPFSTRYQNCNQWVIELLGAAWGALPDDAPATADARDRAQLWLYRQRYAPTVFQASAHPIMWLSRAVPWLHDDDHPPSDLDHDRYSVSMPSSIETFVHRTVPGATRLELCHAGRRVVVHAGWEEIADGCVPGPGDRVIDLGVG